MYPAPQYLLSTYLATDGARAHEVSRAEVASSDGVVTQLLLHTPIQELGQDRGLKVRTEG